MGVVIPILVGVFGVIAFVIFIIYNAYLNSKDKKFVTRPNMPFIEFESELRKSIIGYGRGVVESQISKPNNTVLFKIYPDDVLQGEDVKRPDFKEIIIHKSYIKRYAEGEKYPKRQAIVILPFDRSDLPESQIDTLKGKYLEEEGQNAFAKQLVGVAFKNNREAIIEAMKEYAFGEISKVDQKRLKDMAEKEKQIINTVEKPEEKK